MLLWLRSLTLTEGLSDIGGGTYSASVCSRNGGFQIWTVIRRCVHDASEFGWYSREHAEHVDRMGDWHFRWCGFGIGEAFQAFGDGTHWRVWVIPYWSIVISLNLLSAYLILWNAGKRTRPNDA